MNAETDGMRERPDMIDPPVELRWFEATLMPIT